MSVKAVTWALEQEIDDPISHLLLVNLANYAHPEHHTCFPSQDLLAKRIRRSTDTVQRHLRKLEKSGHLKSEFRADENGHRTSNLYILNVDVAVGVSHKPKPHRCSKGLNRKSGGPKPQNGGVLNRTLDAVGTVNLEPKEETPLPPKGGPTPLDALRAFESYNACALRCAIPQAARLTPDRQRKIIARLRDYGMDGWDRALANIERSSFLRGANDRSWRASLDFLLQPASFSKVHDGTFGNGAHAAGQAQLTPEQQAHKKYFDDLAEEARKAGFRP